MTTTPPKLTLDDIETMERELLNKGRRTEPLTPYGLKLEAMCYYARIGLECKRAASIQAENESLWFVKLDGTQTIGEAYLQAALRKLHRVCDGEATADICTCDLSEPCIDGDCPVHGGGA